MTAPLPPLSDGPSLARLPRLLPQRTSPGTRLQPMISVRMKKTNLSSLLSSPLPLSHHLQKLSVEFSVVIPTLNLRTVTKEKQLGQEDLGWGNQTTHPPGGITHPSKKEANYTLEACSALIYPPHRLCFTVYVHVILTGKLSFLLIFKKLVFQM